MRFKVIEEKIAVLIMRAATTLLVGALLFILFVVVSKGVAALDWDMLTKTPKGGFYLGEKGGILNAILGSIYLAGGATLIALLFSLPIVSYFNVYCRRFSKRAYIGRFILDVLWGVPSIVYGAFGFIVMLTFRLPSSLLMGMLVVALLIFPVMARAMDEVASQISKDLYDVSYSLGLTRLQFIIHIMWRQVVPGFVTAILVAFGRGIGDAASVLFTAGFTDNLPTSLFQPVATLPLAVFFQISSPMERVQGRAYASALILTVIIVVISIVVRVMGKRFSRHIIK